MNALLPIPTGKSITRREAAFHASAEQYRARANLIRGSIGRPTDDRERGQLLEKAAELERLATELEMMRIKRGLRSYNRSSGIIG
jgi:hypothetical protein